MTITLDGSLLDWTLGDRLETSVTQVAGYEIYGRVESDTYFLALSSPLAIGANSTLWLNTDGNESTGTRVFGSSPGAEFKIEFDAGGVPHLINLTTNLEVAGMTYAINASSLAIEIALPKSLFGPSITALSFFADINNSSFLPGSYSSTNQYTIKDPAFASTFDGNLNDWLPSQRLDHGFGTVSGYEVYGKFANDEFVFGVKSALDIGPGSTFWFNTDNNSSTGYQIFGNRLGAEFNVNIGADGVARLYSGNAGEVYVGNVNYAIAADGKSIEFSLSKSLIGSGVTTVKMFADINDSAFLPGDYTFAPYSLTDPASIPQPAANGYRIAIVYSETSAANYFSETAYSQLFMAAQSQAMAAGIPFDIISESDLTNVSALSAYDAIVFPSFQNVPANYAAIEAALTQLVNTYHIPLITAGNFMTSDANGAVLAGNAYARMQSLLGVTVAGSGTGTVNLFGGDSPIVHDYGNGGLIHSYANIGTQYFNAYGSGLSTVIAQQTINGGSLYNAVLGTVTGGRNVHFATDSFFADNNLLGEALDWVTENAVAGPQLSLHMTRGESIFASRTDVDQAMETADVNGGILGSLVSILQTWKTQFNFVGSYYVDIGLYPEADQTTNWAVSTPYYQQLLAMGNEIGSHSFSHPENTNLLLPDVITQAILDQVKADYAALYPTGPGGRFTPYSVRGDAVQTVVNQLAGLNVAQINTYLAEARAAADPLTLDPIHKALLEATFSFQFATAKQFIESHLGITLSGAAVPGAPEFHDTATQIIQYYDYLTGGGSLVGAGYPGAFGYLDPAHANNVYLAPNTSFDFTLVGFQGLTPAQALAKWIAEFNSIMANSDNPVVVWPWHDYGPTQWMVDAPTASPYTLAMYTDFIQMAFNAGAEFVTLADLAQRIKTFDHTNLSFTVAGDTITAAVTPAVNNLGTFALDIEAMGAKHIQNVTGWYAYDNDSIFLDADGGSFQIHLGTVTDDVTHITSIGQRAKLMSLTGDGTNLSFTIAGEGKVVVDLKLLAGYGLTVTGATYTQAGDILTLDLGANGSHAVTIQQTILNTAPTDITVSNLIALPENTAVRTKVANLAVVDADTLPASLNNIITVSDARFEYDATDGGLYLKAGQVVDFETQPLISMTLTATDAANPLLTYSEPLSITVLNGNDGLGVLPPRVVSMERASTDTPLNLAVPADPDGDVQTFVVSSLPSAGALRLGGVAVTAGQVLTLAQFQALTYSFPDVAPQDIGMVIQVNDGHGHLDPLTVTLRVTAGVNSVLNGTAAADRLDGAFGDDTLNGLGGNDTLIGGIGNDTMDGGTGSDTMYGGAGNDRFYADTTGDLAVEAVGGGSDTLFSTVSYALLAGQEIETLSARTTSSTTALTLSGNEFANTLIGNAGVNILDGGAGADSLNGLGGNDQYYVDNAGDQVFESAGGGSDSVFSTVSYALLAGQQIETLSARDTASTTAINLTGNELANTIIGNAGANTLDGRAGADTMSGGAGNDTYVVDNAGDVIVEGAGQGTLDRVNASISYALAAGLQVEALATTNAGGTGALNLIGNELIQTVTGNAGSNVINGKGGSDTLTGGAGSDFFLFDTALGASNIDIISDFNAIQDRIQLDDAIFTGLTSPFTAAQFALNSTGLAQDATDRIIYRSTTGGLYYDSDGIGGAAAVQFATVAANLAVTFTDFIVV